MGHCASSSTSRDQLDQNPRENLPKNPSRQSKMSMLRRTSGSLTKTVRQITQQQPVKDNVLRTTALGSAKVAVQNIGSSMPKTSKANKGQMMVNQITSIRRQNPMQFLQRTTQFSLNVQTQKWFYRPTLPNYRKCLPAST